MKFPLLAAALIFLAASATQAADTLVYFGTYTKGKSGSEGIYVSRLDSETGKLSAPQLAAKVSNPSFVAIHPNHQFLYAVSEVSEFEGKPGGALSAFRIEPGTGNLTLLNAQSTGGGGPCHVSIDPSGRCALIANYGGGSCASFPIHDDGRLGEAGSFIQHTGSSINPNRQKEPHAHSANPSPDGRYAFVADLGTDHIQIYRLDPAAATLTPHGAATVAPGSGPRHFAIHPNGKWAWIINEMALTLTGFAYDTDAGRLTEIQSISTVPDSDRDQKGLSTAEVQVHPSGNFVYGSNRGHHTIAVFRVNAESGQLTWVENAPIHGKTPRNFGIDPSGRWLLAAGQDSDTITVFSIDPSTGALTFTGQEIAVGTPVCVKFLPLP